MIRFGLGVLSAVATTLIWSAAGAAQQIVQLGDEERFVVSTKEGEVQLWRANAAVSDWQVQTKAPIADIRRRIALVAGHKAGRILVVERHGRVLEVDAAGKTTARLPLLGQFNLKSMPKGDESFLSQLASIDHVAAAAAAEGTLYLASDQSGVVTVVDSERLMADTAENVLLGPIRYHIGTETSASITVFDEMPASYSRTLHFPISTEIGEHFTAIAVCGATVIAGSNHGTLYFLPTDGNQDEMRIRQVSAEPSDFGGVLDAGCLGHELAYTVTFPTGNGQIQLWDLTNRAMLDSVDKSPRGSPLITTTATPSADGKRLLTLGDMGLRVFDVAERRLTMLNQLVFDNTQFKYSAGVRGDGFVLFDGHRLLSLPANGAALSSIDGSPRP